MYPGQGQEPCPEVAQVEQGVCIGLELCSPVLGIAGMTISLTYRLVGLVLSQVRGNHDFEERGRKLLVQLWPVGD